MSGRWSRNRVRFAVAVWTSFLAAILEVGVFFSYIYPWDVERLPDWLLDPNALYGVVFFFFWVCSFAATALTAFMIGTSRRIVVQDGARQP